MVAVIALALSAVPAVQAQNRQSSGPVVNSHCCAIGIFGPSVPLGSVGASPMRTTNPNVFRHDGFRNDGQHHHNRFGNRTGYGYVYPYLYSPYGYGYYDTTNVDSNAAASNNYEQPANNDEGPGLTVFERRRTYDLIGDKQNQDPRYGEHYTDSREARNDPAEEEGPAPSQSAKEPSATFPTLLIFKDGSHREITNYALMGNSIYDLSVKPGEGKMRILLADLDLPATIAANDERGIDFKLPKTQ